MSATQELKRAIIRGNLGKAEKLVRKARSEGVLPQSTLIAIQNQIAMARWETKSSTAMNKLRAIVATKI